MKEAWGGVIALIFILFVILPAGRAIDAALPQPVAVASAQVTTLCELRFDPPVEGVLVCWQNRCFETDARGIWKHSITVTAGQCQWYEFVITEGDVVVEGARGPSNAYVMLMSDKRIRFRFNSTPGAASGPFVLSVVVPTATATRIPSPPAAPTGTPTPGPSPTSGPSATATRTEPPTPDWPPVPKPPATLDPNFGIPWLARRLIEQRSYEEEDRGNIPNLAELEQDRLYIGATTHSSLLALWVQGYETTGPKNWHVPAGRVATGSFLVEYEGDLLRCIAFSNFIATEVQSSGRMYLVRYASTVVAETAPGSTWEVPQ